MHLSDFDFDLPAELIAQTPLPRGESRLLVVPRTGGALEHTRVRELLRILAPGDLLVVNDSRVFPARLLGRRVPAPSSHGTPPGGNVECLLLAREEAGEDGTTESGVSGESQIWSALMHPGQKLKPGARVRFDGPGDGALMAEVLERQFYGRRRIRLWVDGRGSIDDLVDAIGHIPLPPYIRRPDTDADRERYQTMFAASRGSVAAPTAGLHFDRRLLDALRSAGVECVSVTLHVGYGTFKPVRVETIEEHVVDPEPYTIAAPAAAAINAALDAGRRIVAVGTTTTRALEDAARRGGGRLTSGHAEATLFIHPGFDFRVVGALLTNFHLPKSSLLMLVCAFAGLSSTGSGRPELVEGPGRPEPVEGRERILEAYRQAIQERYRFYSYGDAMLIV